MGLRTQGLGWVLGLTLGLGALGLGLLTRQLASSFDALERQQLVGDIKRLRAGLVLLANTHLPGTREWAQWSEMREHVLKPSTDFRDGQLSPRSLAASGLDWLVVLRADGTPLEAVSADASPMPLAILLDRGTPRGQRLVKMPPDSGLCALDRWRGQLAVICQHPIRDGEARLPPVGILLSSQAVDEAQLGALRDMLGLPFRIGPSAELTAGENWAELPDVHLQREDERIRLAWPLRVGDEAPHSLLRLEWSRELRVQRKQTLAAAQGLLVGVALLLGVAVLLLIEVRLVRRLKRLQTGLAELRRHERWSQRLPEDGADEIAALAAEGNHLLARIEEQLASLAAQSRTDALTGLANRRGFEEALAAAHGRCQRNGLPLSLLMLDADHFKRFNDEHGHAAGDLALRTLAEGLRTQVARRSGDLAARWGGEEFVVLFEGSDAGVAAARFAQLRQWLQQQDPACGGPLPAPLRVSAGLAVALAGEPPDALLRRADEALYRAKAAGRDQLAA